MKLLSTRYSFERDNDKWDVIIPAAKRGDNVFKIYRNGIYVISYTTQGCNASMSTAKKFLMNYINHKN